MGHQWDKPLLVIVIVLLLGAMWIFRASEHVTEGLLVNIGSLVGGMLGLMRGESKSAQSNTISNSDVSVTSEAK